MANQTVSISISTAKPLMLILSILSFTIPFTIGGPQVLVGTCVNAIIIFSAVSFSKSRGIFPLLFIPSLAVLARGIVFGHFTPLLIFMLPFIWATNGLLIFGMRKLYLERKINYFISLFFVSLAKSLVLYLIAFSLVGINILPVIFLKTMGLIQFITATLGGILVFVILQSFKINQAEE